MKMMKMILWIFHILILSGTLQIIVDGCQFYPPGEYLRFVRVPENLKVGEEVIRLSAYPRNTLTLHPIDKQDEDVHYFTHRDLNRTTVSLLLARSLEQLVDTENPRNVLKFKVSCDYDDGEDIITSSLSVTVYVEDVNDNAPVFTSSPYHVIVDELTPVGLTIFRGIRAVDRDKPNTPNSDVQYVIVGGNERGKFALDSSHQASIILKKALDFDTGDRDFLLTITASDRGVPSRSTNTTLKITVTDNDDLSPKFTKGVYRTKINEFYPITGERIHKRLHFETPIHAFDQDAAIDTKIRYEIIAGNERQLFSLDPNNGSLFLDKEIDIDAERSLPANTFVLQIQATQIDNPLKTGLARVEVEVVDLNDNLPEFEVDFYNISIVENLPNGFSVLQIGATDQDQGDNSEFSYQLEDQTGGFTLDSRTGWLNVRDQNVLDREKRSTLTMRVYAKEKVPSVVSREKLSATNAAVTIEITLLDANDNNPTFIPNHIYDFSIDTALKMGDPVGRIHAIDPDVGLNGLVQYSIQRAPNTTIPFQIDPKTGQITVDSVQPLNVGKHLIFVEASDQPLNPSEKRSALAVVSIDVRLPGSRAHINGYPDFIGAPYEFWVGANVGIGTSVGQIRVSNVPNKKEIIYDLLHSYHEGVPFAVEERSGTITVVHQLGAYKKQHYDFEAVVTNERDISLTTNVTIHIVDPKDEKTILMKAGKTPIEFHVKENQANMLIGKLGFKHTNTTVLKFSIANQKDVTDHVSITSDGALYTEKALNREDRDIYRLTIIAEFDKGQYLGTGIYQVIVHVDDENDNRPQFDREKYEGKIRENCISGTEVDLNYAVHVNDLDVGENGQFTVTIFGNGSEMFRLDRNTGKIYFNGGDGPIDREEINAFNLRLVAKDRGDLSTESKLVINVEDENDNAPVFLQFIVFEGTGAEVLSYDATGNRVGHFEELKNATPGVFVLTQAYMRAKRPKEKISPLVSLKENIHVGSAVIKLIAEDRDVGDNSVVRYEMVSETYIPNEVALEPFHITQYFMVHPTNGAISITRALPPESEFRLNISAIDKGGLKDFISVRLLIRDVNDHPPVFTKSWYNFDTEEASYSRRTLGKIEANDADFGTNANVTYRIRYSEDLPFVITPQTGVLSVNGLLDRETRDKYAFIVVANDNPIRDESLSSTVTVEVNILDINDNPPVFYGYDDVIVNPSPIVIGTGFHQHKIPVYYATAAENSPTGTPITKVFANDSDYAGNGNGLILFDIPYKKNKQNLFAIDSKDGVITTIGKLDYEQQKGHNITIIASDLGSPSLSSTAILVVKIIDVPEDFRTVERPVFAHRYYEVEVEENVPVPLQILTLNVTEPYRTHKLRYSIVAEKGSDAKRMFRIDPRNGSLFLVESPDREKRALYELIIRLDQYKIGRDMTVMIYPVTNERLGNLGLNEVKVIVRITDVNDNTPKFTISGRPIISAIPTTASYGYHIIKLQAQDTDLNLNGEIRYQILGRPDDTTRRFAIDPVTGQIRAVANFIRDAGKMFGFDVKATDRRGGDDGKSSIANVLVYVLDDQKQLVMVMDMKPTDIERNLDNITSALHNTTGFDVRVRKLEPHVERNYVDNSITDLYLYAVDPFLNVVVDIDNLQKILEAKVEEIEYMLSGSKVLAISSGPLDRSEIRSHRSLLSSLEVGVVILGCLIILASLGTAVCIMCLRRRKKRLFQKHFSQPMGYTLAANSLVKPNLFPANFDKNIHYSTRNGRVLGQAQNGYLHQVESAACPRIAGQGVPRERSRSSGCFEKSLTSVHSSGQDSGIVDNALRCQCEQSSSPSSGASSNGYEDSLQSENQGKSRRISRQSQQQNGTPYSIRNTDNRRSRNRSLTEDIVVQTGNHTNSILLTTNNTNGGFNRRSIRDLR